MCAAAKMWLNAANTDILVWLVSFFKVIGMMRREMWVHRS